MRVPRGRPKLGAFVGVIDGILAADADPSTPRKQRHTARRIFERLRDEHGYTGSEVTVRRYVAEQRRVSGEVFVPLSQPAGEAQFDFGEATVEIAGVRVKAALAVMTLPYSDAFFVSAYPRECTETFQAGHVAAFAFFGGVPTKTAYDNTKIAVSRIIGRQRADAHTGSSCGWRAIFCSRTASAGSPEATRRATSRTCVGYGRRNFLVPVPSFGSFTELNAHLRERCLADLQRRLRGKAADQGGAARRRPGGDAAAARRTTFEPRRVEQRRANSLSLVRFDRNDYSVPTAFAHHELTVTGGIEQVAISSGTELVATHPRDWGAEHTAYDPRHYLALLERKPGAFDFARPLERWDLPAVLPAAATPAGGRSRLEGHPRVHQGAAADGACEPPAADRRGRRGAQRSARRAPTRSR